MLIEKLLRAMWPSAADELVSAIATAAPASFVNHGMTSDLHIAHAMAQFDVECGRGTEMTENINYTPQRACAVWPNRFSSAADCLQKVGSFAGDPNFKFKLIDQVYGGRNGNTEPHDGSTYIGRGLSQVTGRGNYQALADMLANGLDLVGTPDLVNEPDNALECGVVDMVLCGCLPHMTNDDLLGVSSLLNVGHLVSDPSKVVGFSQRAAALQLWKFALGVKQPPLHSSAWVQVALNRLGADPMLVPDGSLGPRSRAALQAFQTAHGLTPANGMMTPATLAALDTALEALPQA
jgi:putative chitinase